MTSPQLFLQFLILTFFYLTPTGPLQSQAEHEVTITVRNGDDEPNCSARKGVRIDDNRKCRTGWFGRSETAKLTGMNKISLTSTYKSNQTFMIGTSSDVQELVFYMNTSNFDSSKKYNYLHGRMYFPETNTPIGVEKLCVYFDNILIDSSYTTSFGDYGVEMLGHVQDRYHTVVLPDQSNCPQNYRANSGGIIDLTVVENPDDTHIDVWIPDTNQDYILGRNSTWTDLHPK